MRHGSRFMLQVAAVLALLVRRRVGKLWPGLTSASQTNMRQMEAKLAGVLLSGLHTAERESPGLMSILQQFSWMEGWGAWG